jgi:hypothetical protein
MDDEGDSFQEDEPSPPNLDIYVPGLKLETKKAPQQKEESIKLGKTTTSSSLRRTRYRKTSTKEMTRLLSRTTLENISLSRDEIEN